MKILIFLVVAFTSSHAAKQLFNKDDQQVLLSSASNVASHLQSSNVVPHIAAIPVASPISRVESVSQSVIPGSVQTSVQSGGIISHEASPQLYWPSRIINAPIASHLYTTVKPFTAIDKLPVVSSVNYQSAPLVYQSTVHGGYSNIQSAPLVYQPAAIQSGYSSIPSAPLVYQPTTQSGYSNIQSAPVVYQPNTQSGYSYVYSPWSYAPGYAYQILRK